MGDDSQKDGQLVKFMKKAMIVYSALVISSSPLEGSFINAFRVKNVMAETAVVKEKSPKEAASTFFMILNKIRKAPDQEEVLRPQAADLLEQWGSDSLFKEEFIRMGLVYLERALEGKQDAYEMFHLTMEVAYEKAIFKDFRDAVKEFANKEIRKEDGKYYNLYSEFKNSPFYIEDEKGKFKLGDLLGYVMLIKPAEAVVSYLEQGNTKDAKRIYDENKHDDMFVSALAWKTFLIVEDVVANGRRNKIDSVSLLLGLQDEGEVVLTEKFKEIFNKHTAEGGRYYDLYIGYKEYAAEKGVEATLNGFLETMCDVHDSMKEGVSHIYPFKLVSPLHELSKIKPQVVTTKEAEIEVQIAKATLEQAMKYIEKRTKDIRKVIKDIRDDIEAYVTDKEAKKRLNAQIDAWEKQLNEWDEMLAKAKEIKKKKKFTPKETEFLEKLIYEVAADETKEKSISYFVQNEMLNLQEVRELKQLAMTFVNAMMTGSSESYSEFKKRYSDIAKLENESPSKYLLAIDFIGACLDGISPEVYSVVKIPEASQAIEEIYTLYQKGAKAKEVEGLKARYGSHFVDYVLANINAFEDILLTPEEERPDYISKNYKEIYEKAELVYRVPENMNVFIEEVYLAVESGDKAKIAAARTDYGNAFVDLISKNMDKFYNVVYDPGVVFADDYPELLSQVKKTYMPISQKTIDLAKLDSTLEYSMNFRNSMEFALSETEKDYAQNKVIQAFTEYKAYFGTNIGVLRLFYDVDTMLGKEAGEVKDIGEVESFFIYNIIPSAFLFKQEEPSAAAIGYDVISLYYAKKAFTEITDLEKFGGMGAEVQDIMLNGFRMLMQRDAYLLPSYFENVVKPMAEVAEDPETFAVGLGTFNGLFSNRYNPEMTQLGFLTNRTRSDFKTLFESFKVAVDSGDLKKAMTRFELEEEARLGKEPGPKDFAEKTTLYMPTQPESTKPLDLWYEPGMLLGAPLDLLPDMQAPQNAYLPSSKFKISSDAEGLYYKLKQQVSPLSAPVAAVKLPKETEILPLAQSRLLMFIRKLFGKIPISYSEDLILAHGDAGAYAAGGTVYDEETGKVTKPFAAGAGLESKEKFAEGGLMEYVSATGGYTKVEGEGEEEITTAQGAVSEWLMGGGVGPLGSISQTFTYSGEKGGQHSVKGTLDWLMGLSAEKKDEPFEFEHQGKAVIGFPWDYTWGDVSSDEVEKENPDAHAKIVEQLELLQETREMETAKEEEKKAKLKPVFSPFLKGQGHSILTYVPEAVYETEGGEKSIKGKVYYTSKEGDVIQLILSNEDENLLLNYLFGSGETEHVLTSLRKYGIGDWDEKGQWQNWGGAGALGFSVNELGVALFAMEDAIRRIGYDYVENEAGEMEKQVDLRKLEAVGIASVPIALAISNAFENGTVAFITRLAVPAEEEVTEAGAIKPEFKPEKGVYTLETIFNRVEPMSKGVKHDWEFRIVAGYPFTAGTVIKSKKKEGALEKTWYAKAGTASYFLWHKLLQQEQEAAAVAEYVTNVLVELYHMEEDHAKQKGWMVGGSVMLSGLYETQDEVQSFKEWGKGVFSNYEDIAKWDNTFFTIMGAYYAAKFRLFAGVQKMPGYMLDAFNVIDEGVGMMMQDPSRAGQVADKLSRDLLALTKTTRWKGVTGLMWDPINWRISLLGKAEILAPMDYGYTLAAGSFFVGSKKGIKPYGQALLNTYWFTESATYMDIYGIAGAEKLNNFAPNDKYTFEFEEFENAAELKSVLNKNIEEIMVGMFTKYYMLAPELAKMRAEKFEFVFAPNMAEESKQSLTHYYLLIDPGEGKGYIGNEKDKEKWMELGLKVYEDIFVVRGDGETIEIEASSANDYAVFSQLKGIGGVTLKIEPEVAKAGWTAGLLADIYKDYKTDLLLGTFLAKREFEEEFTQEEWTQFTLVLSGKWDLLNWNEIGDRLFGYVFFNYVDREVSIVPPDEAAQMFEVMRLTGGTGWSWGFFDFALGEETKLEAFVEVGAQKIIEKGKTIEVYGEYKPPAPLPGGGWTPGGFTGLEEKIVPLGEPGKEFIMRAAISYSQKFTNTGPEMWFVVQGMFYRGWWPLAQPLNITQPWLLKSQKDYYEIGRWGTVPWGFMIYGGWVW